MPWPFSESIKKRACRYLLHRYLGNFLEEKLSLDQLSLDLYQGTGSLAQVPLDKWVCVCNVTFNTDLMIWFNLQNLFFERFYVSFSCSTVTQWTPRDGRCPFWSNHRFYPDNFTNRSVGSPTARKLRPRGQGFGDGAQTKTKRRWGEAVLRATKTPSGWI